MIFDAVYCIHLPNKERRKAIEAEFVRVGIQDVVYVHAKVPSVNFAKQNDLPFGLRWWRRNPQRELGCNLSHIKAVVRAISDGAQRPLFVEDDIIFERPIQAPPEYDVLYLGGHPRGRVKPYGEGLYKVPSFSCAEAYSLTNPLEFYEFWCDRIGQPQAMYDFILGEYAGQGLGLAYYPTITKQRTCFSHIQGKVDDKGGLIRKGWTSNI